MYKGEEREEKRAASGKVHQGNKGSPGMRCPMEA